jgi:DNA repair exonuclease SbcCD ATPase subunit
MRIKNFSFSALLAVILVPLLAVAAEGVDYNSSRSNKSGLQGEIQTEVAALDAQLAALQQQMADLEARGARIESLSAELETAESDLATEGEDLAAQYDEASQLFADQIAPLLSPESVAAVTKELEAQRQAVAIATFSDGSSRDLTESLSELGDVLDGLKTALEQAKDKSGTLDSAIKATWNLKENVK